LVAKFVIIDVGDLGSDGVSDGVGDNVETENRDPSGLSLDEDGSC